MNETQKYTPGPWIDMINRDIGAIATIEAKKKNGRITICDFPHCDGKDDEKKANARLIAAAPELLDALEKMIAFVSSLGMEFGRVTREKWEESYDVMKSARKAIDKARGEEDAK